MIRNVDIFSLTEVISLKKIDSNGRFQDSKTKGKNNYYTLFRAIKQGLVTSDDEAKSFLQISTNTAFSKFKSRYIKKLLSNLETSNHLKDQGAILEHEAYGMLTKAKTLQDLADYHNAILIYKKVLKLSVELGYGEVALLAADNLRGIFAFTFTNRKKYEHYDLLVKQIRKKVNVFRLLQEDYDKLSHLYVSKNRLDEFEKFAKEMIHKLESQEYQDSFHRFKIRYFDLMIFLYSYFEQFEKAENIAKVAIKYLEEYPHCRIVDRFLIYFEVIKLKIKRRDFHSALKLLNSVQQLRTRKKLNKSYLLLAGLEFMIYANLKDYDNLVRIVYDVFKDGSVKRYDRDYQTWKIREAYCNLLIILDKISEETVQNFPLKPLKINKFIKDTSLYNKDKRGLNIAIQIVPLLFFLIHRQYEKIQMRIDALKQYSFHYLRKDNTLRSNCFIKMVLKLTEAEYHPIRTERYVLKYKKVLKENPAKLTVQFIDAEIIPYEDLWSMIEEITHVNTGLKPGFESSI